MNGGGVEGGEERVVSSLCRFLLQGRVAMCSAKGCAKANCRGDGEVGVRLTRRGAGEQATSGGGCG